jgi:acetoacetate decarboxylase
MNNKATMVYPPTPWQLRGSALLTCHWVDVDRVRPLIPAELDLISPWPGKTLGGVYAASYGIGSALIYSELIIVAALTRYRNQIGSWISHIYVDNPDSVGGGRELWGLPKELAQFRWDAAKQSVRVYQNEQLLCGLSSSWRLPGVPLPLPATTFSTLGSDLLCFEVQNQSHLHLVGANLEIPLTSPFFDLSLGQPWLGTAFEPLDIEVKAPRVVGEVVSGPAPASDQV